MLAATGCCFVIVASLQKVKTMLAVKRDIRVKGAIDAYCRAWINWAMALPRWLSAFLSSGGNWAAVQFFSLTKK